VYGMLTFQFLHEEFMCSAILVSYLTYTLEQFWERETWL